MENNNNCSVMFSTLKKRVLDVDKNDRVAVENLFNDCEKFITGVMLDGLNSYNRFYQSYCAYAQAMGVEYCWESAPMCVAMTQGKVSFRINPILTIETVDNDMQILFIVAHEVKHLIYRHLLRYTSCFGNEVTAVFMNIATDVEVNESLRREVLGHYTRDARYASENKYFPNSLLGYEEVFNILGYKDYDRKSFHKIREKAPVAEKVYDAFDKKCKDTLGYTIPEIVYQVCLEKGSFKRELFKVADTGKSDLFIISDSTEAMRFCKEVCRYLQRTITVFIMSGVESKMPSDGSGLIGIGLSCDDIEELLTDVESLQKSYLDNLCRDGSRSRGSGSGGVEKVHYEKEKTRIRWQSILRSKLIEMSNEKGYTKKRVNRRQPERIELSGKIKKKSVNVVVGIDESGSIGSREYNYFISEIASIVEQFSCTLHLYEFTSKVEEYTKFSGEKGKKQFLNSKLFTQRHSGGTSFQPVFNAIKENRDINDNTLVIMLTDGFGESQVDFHGIRNRLWVIARFGGTKEEYGTSLLSCPEERSNIYPIV